MRTLDHRCAAKTVALTCALLALWTATHRYRGLGGDAELYAVQAVARIHPNLRHDLFLEHTSQDTYTLFSSLYAACISFLGLHEAALALTIVFKVWFFIAAWWLAHSLSNSREAFLAVALLIVTAGAYGAYGVFRYAEDWVTARSLAEALVITALACHFGGWRVCSVLVASCAMFVHPLMALPGLLLLVCLWSSAQVSAIGAAAAVLASLGAALVAVRWPGGHLPAVMDADWLEVVRERSQFLFLQLWSAADWRLNARPFLSLMLSWLVIDDPRVRKLCYCAILVAAAGLAVALIGGLIGPISLFVQGQAWRWVWVAVFTSVLLLAPTLLAFLRDDKCGPACAILVICAWTVPAIDGSACLACASLLWLMRKRVDVRAASLLRWTAAAAAVLIGAWVVKTCWALPWPQLTVADRKGWAITLVREVLGVQLLSTAAIWSVVSWITGHRSMPALTTASGVLLTISLVLSPSAWRDGGVDGTRPAVEEFADWRGAIAPEDNVFVVPAHNAATFAWFTLERPSYLTLDQSSGVVFSRATALEVRRRSEVLRPLMDPDWTLLSNMRKAHSGAGAAHSSAPTLTRERLISICTDPKLNFVVANENLGFEPIRHAEPGSWRDWNLYDCRRVHP